MAYPLMEHLTGKGFLYCGKYYRVSSELCESLQKPVDIRTYYETVRVKDGVLLFVEDHLQRLVNSVKGLENFPVDTSKILAETYSFIDLDGIRDGSVRIVLTKEGLLIHQADITIPTAKNNSKMASIQAFLTGNVRLPILRYSGATTRRLLMRSSNRRTNMAFLSSSY